jgi:hypothetical protein
MIILQCAHGLTLISSCINWREAISAKEFSSSRFDFLFSRKTLQSNLSWFHKTFSISTTLEERLSKDRSLLTSESESFCDDLPIRHNPVKSPFLHLIFSSSSELEESSFEKPKSLKAAHSQVMIFWNFFLLLSLKWFFLLLSPSLLESFRLV